MTDPLPPMPADLKAIEDRIAALEQLVKGELVGQMRDALRVELEELEARRDIARRERHAARRPGRSPAPRAPAEAPDPWADA